MAEKKPARKPIARTGKSAVISVRVDPNEYAPRANARAMHK